MTREFKEAVVLLPPVGLDGTLIRKALAEVRANDTRDKEKPMSQMCSQCGTLSQMIPCHRFRAKPPVVSWTNPEVRSMLANDASTRAAVAFLRRPHEDGTPCSADREKLAQQLERGEQFR